MDKKILISMLTIDRDSYAIPNVFHSIQNLLKKENINFLLICRITDIECQKKWKYFYPEIKIITVPHYEIKNRHNLDNICKKRNIVLNYARENFFDYLFFIDSDIIIKTNTLEILLEGCEKHKADVCSIPYEIKWLKCVVTGIENNGTYQFIKIDNNEKEDIEYHKGGGGAGCTLIKSTVFNIPFILKSLIVSGKIHTAEDSGFFSQINEKGFLALYVKNHKIEHL